MNKQYIRQLLDFVDKNRELVIMFLTLLKNCKKGRGVSDEN